MKSIFAVFLLIGMVYGDIVDTVFKMGYPKLDKGEKKFKTTLPYKYRLKDFKFKWNVTFFTIVTFVKKSKVLKYSNLSTLYKTDNRVFSQKERKDITYLANLFRKRKNYPIKNYDNYQVIIYIDNKGKMYAIENFKELKSMFGKIDTPAELKVWIDLKYKHFNEYSYKYIQGLWRVRFSEFNLGNCSYKEYFRYYNKDGKYIKKANYFRHKAKVCPRIEP